MVSITTIKFQRIIPQVPDGMTHTIASGFAEGTIGQPEDSIGQDNKTIGMDLMKGRNFYPLVVHGVKVPTCVMDNYWFTPFYWLPVLSGQATRAT